MGAFASTFAPIADDIETIDILLDILGTGILLVSAGVWSKVISQVEEDPDNLGWAKESANAVIEGSLNIAKDALPRVTTALEAQNNLASYVSQLIGSWQGIISTYTENLFSSSTKVPDLSDLSNLMKNGVALNDNAVLNSGLADSSLFNMQNIIENTLFGLLIPKAWQTFNEDVHPAILFVTPSLIPESNR
ncbi:hypothetical protein OEA41_005708 [Lepraria neglecta]|uniref:Uncharacterized protein n=1 Tax=Lepraria neglecta TaxID=209136 RepID=A0AAD9Z9V7_9LECA|nr:hypothetical protein OEA41_005708 [Lepraria neglecta]